MTRHTFLLMLIPALVAAAGGVLAACWQPGRQSRSLIQHFAAGVVLAALAVELLPEIVREHAPPAIVLSAFALGSVLMYLLKIWTEHLEAASGATLLGIGRGLLLATFIDVAVDGFIIGAGFAAGGETGLILSLGLSVELLFLGLALASDSVRPRQIIVVSAALGGTVLIFAVCGSIVLAGASATLLGAVLACSAAALLYLVTEELLMEAHTVEEKPISTLILFAGFLAFWAIQLLA